MLDQANRWYYEVNGQVYGPFLPLEFRDKLLNRQVPGQARVYFFDGKQKACYSPQSILAQLQQASQNASRYASDVGKPPILVIPPPVPNQVASDSVKPHAEVLLSPPPLPVHSQPVGTFLSVLRQKKPAPIFLGAVVVSCFLVGLTLLVATFWPRRSSDNEPLAVAGDVTKPAAVQPDPQVPHEPRPVPEELPQSDEQSLHAQQAENVPEQGPTPAKSTELPTQTTPPVAVTAETSPEGPQPWTKMVQEACVVVISQSLEGDAAMGSGFFVKASSNWPIVVTNHHVVEGAAQIVVKLRSGEMYRIRRGALLPRYDLAFLAVEGLRTVPAVLELRKDLPALTETVYAYGAPKGLEATITRGIVSSLRRTSEIPFLADDYDEAVWVQTDAAINPGNSGGPLLDARGRVVGVTTFKRAEAENLNFAVSAVTVAEHLENARVVNLRPPHVGLAGGTTGASRSAPQTNPWVETALYWACLKVAWDAAKETEKEVTRTTNNPWMSPQEKTLVLAAWAKSLWGASAMVSDFPTDHVDKSAVTAGQALAVFFEEYANTIQQGLQVATRTNNVWLAERQIENLAQQFAAKTVVIAGILEAARADLSQRSGMDFPTIME